MSEDVLASFSAGREKFPSGLEALIRKVRNLGIKYFGVWHTLQGYWRGVKPDSPLARELEDSLIRGSVYGDRLIPEPKAGARRFFDKFYKELRKRGVDFVKVDNQFDLYGYFLGKYPLKRRRGSI